MTQLIFITFTQGKQLMEQVSIDRVVLQCENWSLGHMNDSPMEAWKYFPAVALPGMITVPNTLLLRVPVPATEPGLGEDVPRRAALCSTV